jgi:hypothetical protein
MIGSFAQEMNKECLVFGVWSLRLFGVRTLNH